MRDLLFLSHRIPYPPNKGDKIRSFNLLAGLSKHYRIHLGSFVDDPDDLRHVEHLREYCYSFYLPRLRPWVGQFRGLPSAFCGSALSLARYRHTRFSRWVSDTLSRYPIDGIYAFSSAMGRYGLTSAPRTIRRIMDFVDMDSHKWLQYANQSYGTKRWVYSREYRTLAAEEAMLAKRYDASLLVSEEEAGLFKSCHPSVASSVYAIGNGIDLKYFDPLTNYSNPFQGKGETVVFTGAMDYQPNIAGVIWFCREVWPKVRAASPKAQFYIVGQRPTVAVHDLAKIPGVVVTGRVPDIRPYLAHATVACVPLLIARGVQNKILEALAMGRPVVGTRVAWEGLGDFHSFLGDRVDNPHIFAQRVLAHLAKRADYIQERRDWLERRFSWERSVESCLSILSWSQPRADTTRAMDIEKD